MKRLCFIFLFVCWLSLTASAQTIHLQVKGIDIGTDYSTVLQKLGKPLSNKKGGSYPCDDGQMLTLRYPGLIIELIEDYRDRSFFVASIKVFSPKWRVASGIGIGANLKDVQAKFGSSKPRMEDGLKNLPYFITDGYANFYFRRNKLEKVAWELNAC